MKCPFCGYSNIAGVDECDSCGGNLSSLDGFVPTIKIEQVLMEDPISKLNPREATLVPPEETILAAVRKINRDQTGCVLVSSPRGGIEGIVTERDILLRVLAKKKKPSAIPVKEIMTPNPTLLDEGDTLAQALNLMSVGGYRHLPILREGRPVAVISVKDVLNYLAKIFPSTT